MDKHGHNTVGVIFKAASFDEEVLSLLRCKGMLHGSGLQGCLGLFPRLAGQRLHPGLCAGWTVTRTAWRDATTLRGPLHQINKSWPSQATRCLAGLWPYTVAPTCAPAHEARMPQQVTCLALVVCNVPLTPQKRPGHWSLRTRWFGR